MSTTLDSPATTPHADLMAMTVEEVCQEYLHALSNSGVNPLGAVCRRLMAAVPRGYTRALAFPDPDDPTWIRYLLIRHEDGLTALEAVTLLSIQNAASLVFPKGVTR
ncbi:MAG: hypothetical protein AB7G11_11105 [Phycisphaerales bacterium]